MWGFILYFVSGPLILCPTRPPYTTTQVILILIPIPLLVENNAISSTASFGHRPPIHIWVLRIAVSKHNNLLPKHPGMSPRPFFYFYTWACCASLSCRSFFARHRAQDQIYDKGTRLWVEFGVPSSLFAWVVV